MSGRAPGPGAGAVALVVGLITAGLLLYYHVIVIGRTFALWLGYVSGGIVALIVLAFIVAVVWTALERPPGTGARQ